jgi:hypothetical protein
VTGGGNQDVLRKLALARSEEEQRRKGSAQGAEGGAGSEEEEEAQDLMAKVKELVFSVCALTDGALLT